MLLLPVVVFKTEQSGKPFPVKLSVFEAKEERIYHCILRGRYRNMTPLQNT